jgi:hypothetical protein
MKMIKKNLQGSILKKKKSSCVAYKTKREARVNKVIWLRATEILQICVALSRQFVLTLAFRFVENMQHKHCFTILSIGDVFSKSY